MKKLSRYQIRVLFYFHFSLFFLLMLLLNFGRWEQRIPFQTPVAQQYVHKLKPEKLLPLFLPSVDSHTLTVSPRRSHSLLQYQVMAEERPLFVFSFLQHSYDVQNILVLFEMYECLNELKGSMVAVGGTRKWQRRHPLFRHIETRECHGFNN